MSILLTFLFSAYARSAQFNCKIESARKTLLERQHLTEKLQHVFLSIQQSSLYTKRFPKEKADSLIAIFDNGIDPDPAFSGPVLARLYIDQRKNLSLALWPIEKSGEKRPWRNEILLSHVEDLQFHFLGKKTEPPIAPLNAQLAWYHCWPQKRHENPSMLRLFLKQEGYFPSYAFFFSNPEPLATYWEEGVRL
jgi:hypothetical protein